MSTNRYESVWDAVEDTQAEAENMKIRSTLMRELTTRIKTSGLTQAQAAGRLGVTQPRISDLMRGKIDLFSIDALVNMLAALGLTVDLRGVTSIGAQEQPLSAPPSQLSPA